MKTLDISREHCPMTFVRTKIELERLAPGEDLAVILSPGEAFDNLPLTVADQGYLILSISPSENGLHRMTIRNPVSP